MNELIKADLTMSSLDIAKLVESRHDSVKLSIERLAKNAIIQLPPLVETPNSQGVMVKNYLVGKRDSYVVVAQLSPAFTGRLVDRWQELEAQQQQKLPATYLEALKELVAVTEEKEQLALENAQHVYNDRINHQVMGAQRADVHWLENRLEREIENKKLYGWRK